MITVRKEIQETERNSPIGFQFGKQKSLVDDRYKLVNNLAENRPGSDNGRVPTAEYELYDLVNDPYETENIIDQNPEVAGQMIRQLDQWVASCQQSDYGFTGKLGTIVKFNKVENKK